MLPKSKMESQFCPLVCITFYISFIIDVYASGYKHDSSFHVFH